MENTTLVITDPQLILRIISLLASPLDAQNFANTCRVYHRQLRPTVQSLCAWYNSPSLLPNMYELLFACNMLQHASVFRLDIPLAMPWKRSYYTEQLRQFWMLNVPLVFLMKRDLILNWSREAAPCNFERLSALPTKTVSDVLELMLDTRTSQSLEHNFANLVTAVGAVPILLDAEFEIRLQQARSLQQLCQLNEAAVQNHTMRELQQCLDSGQPLKIEMYEQDSLDSAYQSVKPIVTEIPRLDHKKGRFFLRLRFPNEPETQNMIFEWRPENAMFRARRKCTLRSSPYLKPKEYSMRLRPARYSVS